MNAFERGFILFFSFILPCLIILFRLVPSRSGCFQPKLSDSHSLPAPCTKCRGKKLYDFHLTYSVKPDNF